MRTWIMILALAAMLLAAACGKVEAPDVEFDLPNPNEGPEYGAPTP